MLDIVIYWRMVVVIGVGIVFVIVVVWWCGVVVFLMLEGYECMGF